MRNYEGQGVAHLTVTKEGGKDPLARMQMGDIFGAVTYLAIGTPGREPW